MNATCGATVSFKWNGRYLHGGRLIGIYDFKNARKVEHKGLEYIVEASEVKDAEDIQRENKLRVEAENLRDYGDLVTAWQSGKRTNADLAKATNTPINGIASRLRAAKRRGLLK